VGASNSLRVAPTLDLMKISVWGAAVLAGAALLAPGAALGLPEKLSPDGRAGFAYGDAGAADNNPTSDKPESKLFYTPDGRWWAVLGVGGAGLQLHELVDHVWQARVALPRTEPWYRADVLFDARDGTLFVSARDGSLPGAGGGAVLYRTRYRGGGSWAPPGGPTRIGTSKSETVTIARDGERRLWATWEENENVRVMATRPGRFRFSDVRPPGRRLLYSDISAVTAFGTRRRGRKIGVMWSDQRTGRFRFAWRRDSERLGKWHVETAYGGGRGCDSACADDHINLKAAGDSVYAVVKTSRNDFPNPNPADPLIVLLRRDARSRWASFPVSPVEQNATRPAVLLGPRRGAIWVFARLLGDNVAVWESRFSSPRFSSAALSSWTSGLGTFNDPTTTKQVIPPGRATVVITSKEDPGEYWHNEFLP
jgi:hypothetical protein